MQAPAHWCLNIWLPICLHQIQLDRRLNPCRPFLNNFVPRNLFSKRRKHHRPSSSSIWSKSLHFRGVLRIPLCSGLSPNIIGTLKVGYLPGLQNLYQIQGGGVFSNDIKNGYFERVSNGSNATGSVSVNMNASNSSSVFRDLNTVQPAALQTLIIIKVWTAADWTVELFPYVILFLEASKLRLRMAPTEALPLTISNPNVPYKAPDKASAPALRNVFLVVPVMFGFEHSRT